METKFHTIEDPADDNKDEDMPKSYEEMKKEYDARNKYRDLASAKMGELMLAGWTLLGVTCPTATCGGMPLMSLQGGPMKCVLCEKNYEFDSNQDLKLTTGDGTSSGDVSSTATTVATAVDAATTSNTISDNNNNNNNNNTDIKDDEFYLFDAPVLSSYRNDSNNDASSKIAKYLIQGKLSNL